MIFKIGKYYKHTGGEMLHIIGGAKTTMYGWCLIAGSSNSNNLQPVGQCEDNAQNWKESTEEEWLKNFS